MFKEGDLIKIKKKFDGCPEGAEGTILYIWTKDSDAARENGYNYNCEVDFTEYFEKHGYTTDEWGWEAVDGFANREDRSINRCGIHYFCHTNNMEPLFQLIEYDKDQQTDEEDDI